MYFFPKLICDHQKLITCLTVLVILIFQGYPSFNIIKLMWSLLFDKVDLCMAAGGFDPPMCTISLDFRLIGHSVESCVQTVWLVPVLFLAFHVYLQSLLSFFVLAHAIAHVYYKSNGQTLAWFLYLMLTIDDGLLFLW